MTDLTKRLRAGDGSKRTAREAAKEIKRLVAVIKRINDTIYASGARLGTDNYFLIRELCAAELRAYEPQENQP